METTLLTPCTPRYRHQYLLLLFALGAIPSLSAQSFENGDFEEGSTGWTDCNVEVVSEFVFGIPSTGSVARVDGNLDPGPADDRVLCQSIPGFTVGNLYRIDLDVTRSAISTAPDPMSATLTMDDALSRTITRSGGYSMEHEDFIFTATRSTHTFRVVPDLQSSEGLLFDNLSITALPVMSIQLLAFNAEPNNNGVQFYWTTASEQNNAYFTLQRSTDGLSFTDVLRTDGVGNSAVPVTYVAMDPAPIEGLSYYRLQQTNIHGVVTTFQIVPTRFEKQLPRTLTVYPNPTAGSATWMCARDLKEEVVVPLTITDLQGTMIFQKVMTITPGTPVDLSSLVALPPGTYTVYLPLAGEMESVRLLVL